MNHIVTHLSTFATMILAIEKPTAAMRVAIQSNLQFKQEFIVLHTWATL